MWLRFKAVSWRHDFQPCTAVVWDCLIAGSLWLHHIWYLANVTMTAIAIGKVGKLISSSQNYLLQYISCLKTVTEPNVGVERLTLLLRILEVPGSNLSPETD
jgi:hypothetical protein